MKRTLHTLVLLLALGLLGACSDLSLKKPEVQVASIEAGKTSLLEQDFTVTLRVRNPNNRDLNAKGLYFDLTSRGKKIGSGLSNQAIAIPAMGEGTVPLTVHTSLLEWLQLVQSTLQQGNGKIAYQIDGYLDGLNGWGRIPFKREGQWTLPH